MGPFDRDNDEVVNQVRNILLYDRIDDNYKDLSRQQLEDIITCAATKIYRDGITQDFRFTDLDKDTNYIGFESGIFCVFPEYESSGSMKSGIEGEL